MFDDLSDLSDSPASYLAVLALVALDAVFPVAPSETVLVTGGILIERGDLIAPLFVLATTCGVVLGAPPSSTRESRCRGVPPTPCPGVRRSVECRWVICRLGPRMGP